MFAAELEKTVSYIQVFVVCLQIFVGGAHLLKFVNFLNFLLDGLGLVLFVCVVFPCHDETAKTTAQ